MWKVSNRTYLFFLIPFLIIGIGIIIGAILAPPDPMLGGDEPTQNQLFLMGAATILFPLLTTAGIAAYYKKINDREINLVQNGIQGVAQIVSREQTGMYINEQPQIRFVLSISLPGRPVYQADHKDIVNLLDVGAINVGAKLPVFVDPNNDKNLLLVYNFTTPSSQA